MTDRIVRSRKRYCTRDDGSKYIMEYKEVCKKLTIEGLDFTIYHSFFVNGTGYTYRVINGWDDYNDEPENIDEVDNIYKNDKQIFYIGKYKNYIIDDPQSDDDDVIIKEYDKGYLRYEVSYEKIKSRPTTRSTQHSSTSEKQILKNTRIYQNTDVLFSQSYYVDYKEYLISERRKKIKKLDYEIPETI